MDRYVAFAVILQIVVDFLLLMSVGWLWGKNGYIRYILGAVLGGVYTFLCLQKGFSFLSAAFWRSVFLLLSGFVSFDLDLHGLRRTAVYVLLRMALVGISVGKNLAIETLIAAAVVAGLLVFGLKGQRGNHFVPVEIGRGDQTVKLTALRDTGNRLYDPISGKQVLIVGADVAKTLTGLSSEQLQDSVSTVQAVPGLRLVSYKTVGTASGLLLAKNYADVRIGNQKGSVLVAFSPVCLDSCGKFQALTGGL